MLNPLLTAALYYVEMCPEDELPIILEYLRRRFGDRKSVV